MTAPLEDFDGDRVLHDVIAEFAHRAKLRETMSEYRTELDVSAPSG